MKTIELSTGTLLVANTPEGFTNGMVVDDPAGTWLIGYSYVGKLPSSGFQLLGHPSEITGEVWDTIVDEPLFDLHYVDYTIDENDGVKRWGGKYTLTGMPLESGLSLCAAHNIHESDVLLFKHKNS